MLWDNGAKNLYRVGFEGMVSTQCSLHAHIAWEKNISEIIEIFFCFLCEVVYQIQIVQFIDLKIVYAYVDKGV